MCEKRNYAKDFVEAHVVENHVHVERPYTLVALVAEIEGRKYYQSAMSKCGSHDQYNEGRGIDVATGRALVSIAKRVGLIR
jgi:hypothetical protein